MIQTIIMHDFHIPNQGMETICELQLREHIYGKYPECPPLDSMHEELDISLFCQCSLQTEQILAETASSIFTATTSRHRILII
jgi:hypothetical protein